MLCVVCKDEAKKSPYRCPQCKSPYCSVVCYKQHKLVCTLPAPSEPGTPPSKGQDRDTVAGQSAVDTPHAKIYASPRVQELLKSEGVSKYLRVVAEILHDPKLSGEHSAEGRRIVALKKLRELRKGGREANEAIEELATVVVKLAEHDEDNSLERGDALESS